MYYPKSDAVEQYKVSDIVYNKDGSVNSDKSYYFTDTRQYINRANLTSGPFRNGWHMPTNYSNGFARFSQPTGSFKRILSGGRYEVAGYGQVNSVYLRNHNRNIGTNLAIDVSSMAAKNADNRAATEVLNKLQQGNLRLGVAIAEARQTASLLGRQSVTLLKAYSAARRGRWREVFSLLSISKHRFRSPSKDIGSRWLELQYGWLPLMSDLKAGYDLLTKTQLPERLPLRAVRMVGYVDSYGVYDSRTGSTWNYTDKMSVKYQIWYYISSSRLAWASSLGLLNPLEIVWEKLPYSFVVDWFLPIGNILQSISDPIGCTFLSGVRTWRASSNMNATLTVKGWEGSAKTFGNIQTYNRFTLSGFPTAGVYVKSPLSGFHVANALALINQRFKHR